MVTRIRNVAQLRESRRMGEIGPGSDGELRILLAHERFPPDFGGGGEEIVFETARGLRERGCDVRVVTTGDPASSSHEGIPTIRLAISRYALNLAVPRVAELARDVDLIHTCTYHACLPAWLAGRFVRKPVVCQVLSLFEEAWTEMKGPWKGPVFRALERFLLTRRYARLLFLSDRRVIARSARAWLPSERW